jgi:hypothetical protein
MLMTMIYIIYNCCTFHIIGVSYYTTIQSHKMGVVDSLHQTSKNAKVDDTITNTLLSQTHYHYKQIKTLQVLPLHTLSMYDLHPHQPYFHKSNKPNCQKQQHLSKLPIPCSKLYNIFKHFNSLRKLDSNSLARGHVALSNQRKKRHCQAF